MVQPRMWDSDELDGCTTEDASPIYYGGLPTPPYAPMLYHYALVSTFEHCGFIVVLLTHLDQPTTNEDNGAMCNDPKI
ncbi:hypothetical protein Scep_007364 [Stephania cephalantha]|uniref:Uncharacterized protein n=1 Tax=Stephania cephalantha TaxID=152367 RepID=A0AAP0KCD9_9MAGN